MKTQMLLGASALVLVLGASGANAQTIDISVLDDATLADLLDTDVIDISDINIGGSGDDLSTTLGRTISGAVADADVAVVSAAVNSATVDGSVNVTATPVNLTNGLSTVLDVDLPILGGIEVSLPPISVDGGVAGGATDDTGALAGLVGIDVGLAAVLGGEYIDELVQGGTVDIARNIETTAIGVSNANDIAVAGTSNSFEFGFRNEVDGISLSGYDEDISEAMVEINGNSSTSSATENDGFEFNGGDALAVVSTSIENAGLTDGLLASNLAFNNGFVNGSVNLRGLGVETSGIATTAIGASNSGSLSVGYDGAALNRALNRNIVVGGDN